jgi:hypothetical protein
MSKRGINGKFDSDKWLLKSARKWGVDVNLREVTPEYFENQKMNQRRKKNGK